jgi:hypothetical protein
MTHVTANLKALERAGNLPGRELSMNGDISNTQASVVEELPGHELFRREVILSLAQT